MLEDKEETADENNNDLSLNDRTLLSKDGADSLSAKKVIVDPHKKETTVLEAEVSISSEQFGEENLPKSVTQNVSKKTEKKWPNGTIKKEIAEVSQESFDAVHSRTQKNEYISENKFYNNGNLKSSYSSENKEVSTDPNAFNVAFGHTDATTYGSERSSYSTYNRSGEEKFSYKSERIYGSDFENKTDIYTRGTDADPRRSKEAKVFTSQFFGTHKLNIGDYSKRKSKEGEYTPFFTGEMSQNSESYTYKHKNGVEYFILTDHDGKVEAIKETMKEDCLNSKKLSDRRSRQLLKRARKDAGKVIKDVTRGEYKGTKDYFDSVHSEKNNGGKLGDSFKNIDKSRLEEAKKQVEERSIENVQSMLSKTPEELLNNKLQNSRGR